MPVAALLTFTRQEAKGWYHIHSLLYKKLYCIKDYVLKGCFEIIISFYRNHLEVLSEELFYECAFSLLSSDLLIFSQTEQNQNSIEPNQTEMIYFILVRSV